MFKTSYFVKALWFALAAMVTSAAYEITTSFFPRLSPSHAGEIVLCTIAAFILALVVLRHRESGPLKFQKADFDVLVEHIPGLACIVDTNLRLVRWNSRFQAILGYSDSELREMPAPHTLAEDYRELVPAVMGRAWELGYAEMEAVWLSKSGVRIPCYMTGVRILIGNQPCILSVAVDISSQKRAEEALRKSEEQYRRLLTNLPDVAWTSNLTGQITYVSPNVHQVFGQSAQQVCEGGIEALIQRIHPDDRAAVTLSYRKLFQDNAVFDVEYRLQRLDGQWRWVHDRAIRTHIQEGVLFADGVLSDITERKQVEEDLHKSQEQYRRLLTNLPDLTWTMDSERRLTYVSPNVEELFGFTPAEVFAGGQDFRLAQIHPDDRDALAENYQALFVEGRIFDLEYRMRRRDGRWIWVRNRALRTFEQDGKRFADGILSDVTLRKQAEEVNAQLAAIVTSSGDAIIGKTPDGTIVSWNPAAETMYGYSVDEAIGKHVSMLIPPERLREVPEILSKVARGEQSQSFDSICLRKNGTCFDVSLAVAAIKDKRGRVLGISTIAHDITLRKQAEDALRRSEQNLTLRNQIFNVFLTGTDQEMYNEVLRIVLQATNSPHGLFGYIAEDGALVVPSMSSEVWEACQVTDKQVSFPHDAWAGIWGRALDQKQAFYSNYPSRVPGGHIGIARAMAIPILYQDVAIGLLVVANKQTDYQEADKQLLERVALYLASVLSARLQRDTQEQARQRTEQELIQARDLAQEGNRAKTQFLANVSHELRTPMNGILGMAELALDTQLDAEQRESLLVIQSSGIALLRLIDDLLDFTRTEAGSLALDSIAFHLPDTVRQTLRPMRFQAQQVGLEFLCQLEPELPDMVIGDPQRLRQVLVNLVGNAIKFTQQGSVAVRAACNALAADRVELLFEISDTGIGVPPEKHATIFEGFTQSDGSSTRKYGGTGLGLAISSHLVQLMHGKIWVESNPGQGSIFRFTIQLPVAEPRNSALQLEAHAVQF
ncbi:MAG: PAS domain S-box protein [Candidatus Korobacteraceae bacterium]